MTYSEYEEAVYKWLMSKHEKDPNFTFSLRRKGMKGAKTDYFIGTENSGYFGTTFWQISVSYAGSFSEMPDSDRIGLLAKEARVKLSAFKKDVASFIGEVERIKGELRTKIGEIQGIIDCLETKVNG